MAPWAHNAPFGMVNVSGQTNGKVQPISVETGTLKPAERFDFLNDVYARERLILAPRRPIGSAISAGTTLWEVGALRYARTFSSGHIGRRVKDRTTSFLAIRKHFTGGCHSWAEDGYFATEPGDIIMTLNTVDGVHACQALDTTNIALPLDALNVDFSTFQTTQILRADSLANRLLSVGMEAWTAGLRSASPGDVEALERDIISLVNHVLGSSFATEDCDNDVARMRARAMRTYIQDKLFTDALSVQHICDTFGASRASVYREFAPDGGVQRYMTRLRLQKALFLLSSSPLQRGAITDVAHQLGYDDPSVFSRAFRAQFGFSPSDAVALHYPSSLRAVTPA